MFEAAPEARTCNPAPNSFRDHGEAYEQSPAASKPEIQARSSCRMQMRKTSFNKQKKEAGGATLPPRHIQALHAPSLQAHHPKPGPLQVLRGGRAVPRIGRVLV